MLSWNDGATLLDCFESVRRRVYFQSVGIRADNGRCEGSLRPALSWIVARLAGGEDVEFVQYDRAAAEAGGGAEAKAQLSVTPAPGRQAVVQVGANLGYAGGSNFALTGALGRGLK